MMAGARDPTVSKFSSRLRDRQLYKCIDLQDRITNGLASDDPLESLNAVKEAVLIRLNEWIEREGREHPSGPPRILIDEAKREIYKDLAESKGPLNQMVLKGSDGKLNDVAKLSKVVAAIKPFELCRLYTAAEDQDAIRVAENAIIEEIKKCEAK